MAYLVEDKLKALTVAEVAQRLQVEIRTVYGLLKRRELRAVKIGRVWRVPLGALDRYLTGRKPEAEYDEEPLSAEELADVEASLEAIQRGEYVTLEALERKYGL
jgi:excisionase family DNA binding protein